MNITRSETFAPIARRNAGARSTSPRRQGQKALERRQALRAEKARRCGRAWA